VAWSTLIKKKYDMNLYNYFYYLNCRSIKIMEKQTFSFNAIMVLTVILFAWIQNFVVIYEIITKINLNDTFVSSNKFAIITAFILACLNMFYFNYKNRKKLITEHFEQYSEKKLKSDWVKARIFMIGTIVLFIVLIGIKTSLS